MISALFLPLALLLSPASSVGDDHAGSFVPQDTIKVVRVKARAVHRHIGVRRVVYVVPVATLKTGVVDASAATGGRRQAYRKPAIKRAVHR